MIINTLRKIYQSFLDCSYILSFIICLEFFKNCAINCLDFLKFPGEPPGWKKYSYETSNRNRIKRLEREKRKSENGKTGNSETVFVFIVDGIHYKHDHSDADEYQRPGKGVTLGHIVKNQSEQCQRKPGHGHVPEMILL
jgi:hypothetical protein